MPLSNAERQARHRERNPQKAVARRRVGIEKRTGKRLTTRPCVDCGAAERVEAHHEDYAKPLAVIWLCKPCHERRHPQPFPAIYIASKTRHASRWQELRSAHVPIISTWIDEAGEGQSIDRADLAIRCIREACAADRVVLYTEPGEVLKGVLIEAGAALAAGVEVYAVGGADFGVFASHPLWRTAETVEEACRIAPNARRPQIGGVA